MKSLVKRAANSKHSPLKDYAADHRRLVRAAARAAGIREPIAIDADEFTRPLMKAARRGEFFSIDGVFVRDWDPNNRRSDPGVHMGGRLYEIDGIRFAQVQFNYDEALNSSGLWFMVVDRKDYRRLYKIALRCRRDHQPPSPPPVLPEDQAGILWKNTIGYLEERNLRRIAAYGGRARRGVLLTGPPGNGKTMACRWIWEECRVRNWDWRLVTPDSYREARHSGDPQEAVKELFTFAGRGIVFFDDMDLALRDRNQLEETDDQAVFLTAMDGIEINQGVVFVFTTNCALDRIDRAFKRPGRIDVVLAIKPPDRTLRRRLFERWHEDIRQAIDLDAAAASTEGYSFADLEELKTLLIMHFMESGEWSWDWALRQFAVNRERLTGLNRRVGFEMAPSANGSGARDPQR